MSYNALETSQSAGAPVELYLFRRGVQRWTETSGDVAEVYLGDTYTPAPIQRSEPQLAERGKDGTSFTVTVPRDHPVAAQFRVFVPATRMSLTLFRHHRGDAETVVQWTGRVRGVRWVGSNAELQCEGTDAMLKRQALRRGVGINCEHMLYDSRCGLVATAFRATGTLATVAGTTLQGAVFASQPNGWWVSGFVRVANEDYRMVTAHSGDTVTLLSPFEDLAAGDSIEVYAGCDRTFATCGSKFNNQANNGGWPFWPVKNPYQDGLI